MKLLSGFGVCLMRLEFQVRTGCQALRSIFAGCWEVELLRLYFLALNDLPVKPFPCDQTCADAPQRRGSGAGRARCLRNGVSAR